MKLTNKQIRSIAESLESGIKVYINRKDYEIREIFFPFNSVDDVDIENDEVEAIEKKWTAYVVLSQLESSEEYRIMQQFSDQVEDKALGIELNNVLNRKSPFANFKIVIDYSSSRTKWFEFRQSMYEAHVRDQLQVNKIEMAENTASHNIG